MLLPRGDDICKQSKNFRTAALKHPRTPRGSSQMSKDAIGSPGKHQRGQAATFAILVSRRSLAGAPRKASRRTGTQGSPAVLKQLVIISFFVPAPPFAEKALLPHYPFVTLAPPDLCHGTPEHDSLFPSRRVIWDFSNVHIARRSQLH
jgi:hypothetical protein